jgi:hypothetical protein
MCECKRIKKMYEKDDFDPLKLIENRGYRHAMGECRKPVRCLGQAFNDKHYEPPPLHYPRCCSQPSSPEPMDMIYNRSTKTTQQNCDWCPRCASVAGVPEGSRCDAPPNHCHLCPMTPDGSETDSGAAEEADCESDDVTQRPSRQQRGLAESTRQMIYMQELIDPRYDTSHVGCCVDKRPQWMCSPRTFAACYRGLHEQLQPENYPREIYRDPSMLYQ